MDEVHSRAYRDVFTACLRVQDDSTQATKIQMACLKRPYADAFAFNFTLLD